MPLNDDDTKIDRGDELPTQDQADDKVEKPEDKVETTDDQDDKTADQVADEIEDETEEEKAAREAEEAEREKAKRQRIPLHRHEEILNKQRSEAERKEQALAARIRELEGASSAAGTTQKKDVLGEMKADIAKLQDAYEEHVFEGRKDEAKQVRAQLDALRDRYTDAHAAATSEAARRQTIDTLKYEQALAKVEADYPALNPDAAEYDQAKENEVSELLTLFRTNGLTQQAALEKAVRYVMGAPAARTDTTADTLRQKREQEARARAAKAAGQQPPASKDVGADNSDKKGDLTATNVVKLSQEAFAKLDEATLSKMRGDTL